jgi:O-antigen biosynthesis protein
MLPGVEIVLAGWDLSGLKIDFPHYSAGNVALSQLAALYSQCDAGLVLSFTNVSLAPLELMACGCPVVSNRGPHVEWLLNDRNSVLADPAPDSLADALFRVLTNDEFRADIIEAGLRFAEATDWGEESMRVAAAFNKIVAGEMMAEEQ